MTPQSKPPLTFTLPLARFDLNLLPPDARQIGTEAFKMAVITHFAAQYAAKGERALVTVDDDEIKVMAFPQGATNALGFIMPMLQAGRIEEALPYLESLAKTDGNNNAEVFYNLGIAYSELSQFDEALIRLKRAVQLDPGYAHAWTGIGVAYQRMGKREQALEPMQKAVDVDPKDGYTRRNLAGLLLSLHRPAEALTHLREARKVLPHDPQTLYGLATALHDVGGDPKNVEEADELFQVVIQRWPGSQVADLARKARTGIAEGAMRARAEGTTGLRRDVVMYITSALDTFEQLGPAKRQQIVMEIALKGQEGLDIHSADRKYTLGTLPGEFSGMQLVAMMYAGVQQMQPGADAGIDLKAEYDAAVGLRAS
jgi:tetratricopeptide (TPR) repeat protein